MKTALSLPDELLREAEAAKRRLRVSRSRLGQSITKRLNRIYSRNDSRLDAALNRAQLKSVRDQSW